MTFANTEPGGRSVAAIVKAMLLTIELQLTPTNLGGKQFPIRAGYSACWANGDVNSTGETVYHDAPIVLLDPEMIEPGGKGSAAIQPISPDAIGWEHVRVGDVLTMVEGSREYGSATVTSIDPGYDRQWSAVDTWGR